MSFIQANAERLPFADKTFDLVFTSPPYADARTYGIGAQRDCQEWIDWMLRIVQECVRVTKGLVIVNCAGVTRDWNYQPGPEGLLYEWWKRGGRCWRPAYWHRVGIPGSGGKRTSDAEGDGPQWLRADIEYVLAFTSCKKGIAWAEATANGHPPKWAPGGEMSYRQVDRGRTNERRDKWGRDCPTGNRDKNGNRKPQGKQITRRVSQGHGPDGDTRQDDTYTPPVLANPGVLIQGIKVGGGLMGHNLAHSNEAPFPLKLAQYFIRGWCPPNGLVLDPFSGSGTTVHAAMTLGRRGIGCDLRFSQCDLGRRRCAEVQPDLFQ